MKWPDALPPRRNLTSRLILVNLAVLLFALAGLVLWTGLRLQTSLIEEAEHGWELKALIVANGLQEPLQNQLRFEDEQEKLHEPGDEEGDETDTNLSLAPFGDRNLQSIVDAYASEADVRITLMDTSRSVRYSSDPLVPIHIEDQHPEIVAALTNGEQHDIRLDEWSQEQRLFVGALVGTVNAPQGIVQLSVPMSKIMVKVRQTWIMLLTTATALAALSILASIFLGRQLTRPVRALTKAANQVAEGDFSVRLDMKRDDELGALAQAFDHMATEISTRLERERVFIANASHELRSPITAIQLRAELLQNRLVKNESRFQRYLVDIKEESEHLGHLLEQLLDLDRLQAGSYTDPMPALAPAESLQQVVQMMASPAHDAGLTFVSDIPESLPPVQAAAQDFELIIRNLVDNAIKYTPAGGEVRLSARSRNDHLEIVVADTGTGIPEADIPHIFDRFYRVDKARDRKGSGLGLAMVKTLVTEAGGDIRVESRLGEGTTVTISLLRTELREAHGPASIR
ncbi:MAG: HAMP domain-containing histidine kinase [Chloroflexi bacterium]|nr:HAMP domain-containing histidine kinase [Chloroflexota bacterium]